jgi:hypothetical protein
MNVDDDRKPRNTVDQSERMMQEAAISPLDIRRIVRYSRVKSFLTEVSKMIIFSDLSRMGSAQGSFDILDEQSLSGRYLRSRIGYSYLQIYFEFRCSWIDGTTPLEDFGIHSHQRRRLLRRIAR